MGINTGNKRLWNVQFQMGCLISHPSPQGSEIHLEEGAESHEEPEVVGDFKKTIFFRYSRADELTYELPETVTVYTRPL